MPHSWPLTTIEMLIDAATPMFCRYSMWIGETLRSTQWLMSSTGVPAFASMGTDAASTFAMSRNVLTT